MKPTQRLRIDATRQIKDCSDLVNMNTRISGNENDINDLQSNVDSQDNRISKLEACNSGNDMTSLKVMVSRNSEEINDTRSDVRSHDRRIYALETKKDDPQDQHLVNRVTKTESDVATNSKRISMIENQNCNSSSHEIASLNSRLQLNETRVQETSTRLSVMEATSGMCSGHGHHGGHHGGSDIMQVLPRVIAAEGNIANNTSRITKQESRIPRLEHGGVGGCDSDAMIPVINRLTSVEVDMNFVKSSQGGIETRLASLENVDQDDLKPVVDRIVRIEDDVDACKLDVVTHAVKIAALENKKPEQVDLSEINRKLASLDTSDENQNRSINGIADELDDLDLRVTKVELTSGTGNTDRLEARLSKAETEIDDNRYDINSAKTDITRIVDRLVIVENGTGSGGGSVDLKPLTSRVESVESDVTDIKADIAELNSLAAPETANSIATLIDNSKGNVDATIEDGKLVLTAPVSSGGGDGSSGGAPETASSIAALIDNSKGNVDATVEGGKLVLTSPVYGGAPISADVIAGLIDNDQGNVDATVEGGKLVLTAPVSSGGGESPAPGGIVNQGDVFGNFITSKTEYTAQDIAAASYVFGASGSSNTCELPVIVSAETTPSETQYRSGRVLTISSLTAVMNISISTVDSSQKIWHGGSGKDSVTLQQGEYVTLYAMHNIGFNHWIVIGGNATPTVVSEDPVPEADPSAA